ncbi:MAG: hypothetical protein K0Q67_2667 [Cellvibrio sp.]|nr:hypothetical protein [Cellvibrio sp.]
MANEADKAINRLLTKVQRNSTLRNGLAIFIVLMLCGILGYFLSEFVPHHYNLKISGGGLLTNRHYLAKAMQEEGSDKGVFLEIKPTDGSELAFEQVAKGELDFAFIQGGLNLYSPNIVHVATVAPELLHFLVRENINNIADLKGKRINLGSKRGGTRIIAKEVLQFSNLKEGVDYVESNIENENLLSFHSMRLPDVIVMSSFVPANMADYLIKKHKYHLLEIPFPSSLALRLGWVADSQILAYMYSVEPAVPERNIKTVGVNLYLIAHKDVDPGAVFKILETLFSPEVGRRLKIEMDEKNILTSANYPLSKGTELYLDRQNPFFSNEKLDQIKAIFAVVLSLASTFLIIVKWFRGESIDSDATPTDDKLYIEFINQVLVIDTQISEEQQKGEITQLLRQKFLQNLTEIKSQALQKLADAELNNVQLPQHLLLAIGDTRSRIEKV